MVYMYIKRKITNQITSRLFQGKIFIIYGPRQSGKTTLVKNIVDNLKDKNIRMVFGDDRNTLELLTNPSISDIATFVAGYDLVVIDEAQNINNIGITLKLLHDHFPDVQVIATGSSSFELANKIVEPLTGRNYEFFVLPFSVLELEEEFGRDYVENSLEQRLIYGSYPEIIVSNIDIKLKLQKIASDYTSKDILKFDRIRRSDKLIKLLQALALQIGQEVSFTELSQTLGIDRGTIERYIEILEQSFIIFRLEPYSNNKRRSLKRLRKIYFYDTGIRNALINNFNQLDLRNDAGNLFENFIISEFVKNNKEVLSSKRFYFWRSYNGEEIDLIVENNGVLSSFECKLNFNKEKIIKSINAPISEVQIITSKNFVLRLKENIL